MSRQIGDLDPITAVELEIADLLALEDVDKPRTMKVTLGELAIKIQDIQTKLGSLYFNADDDRNPAEILGFGTWVKHGEGRVPVGHSTTDSDFATGGQTGGAKNVTLNINQIPAHNHPGSTSTVGNHAHTVDSGGHSIVRTEGGGTNNRVAVGGSGQQLAWGGFATSGSGAHNHSVSTDNRGGGQAHTNLQPYVVVYIWKRTG